jgi:hypothetical protein
MANETKKGKKGEKTKSKKPYRVAKKTYNFKELRNMSESDLKSIKKLLRDNVTRNLRKIKRAGFIETPATIGLSKAVKSGIVSKLPHLGVEPSSDAAEVRTTLSKKKLLIGEIFELQKFQESSTGTVYGMRKFENDTYARVGDAYKNSSKDLKLEFWKLYDEQRGEIDDKNLSSSELQKELADYFYSANGSSKDVMSAEWEKIVKEANKKAMLEEAEAKKNEPKLTPFKIIKI